MKSLRSDPRLKEMLAKFNKYVESMAGSGVSVSTAAHLL